MVGPRADAAAGGAASSRRRARACRRCGARVDRLHLQAGRCRTAGVLTRTCTPSAPSVSSGSVPARAPPRLGRPLVRSVRRRPAAGCASPTSRPSRAAAPDRGPCRGGPGPGDTRRRGRRAGSARRSAPRPARPRPRRGGLRRRRAAARAIPANAVAVTRGATGRGAGSAAAAWSSSGGTATATGVRVAAARQSKASRRTVMSFRSEGEEPGGTSAARLRSTYSHQSHQSQRMAVNSNAVIRLSYEGRRSSPFCIGRGSRVCRVRAPTLARSCPRAVRRGHYSRRRQPRAGGGPAWTRSWPAPPTRSRTSPTAHRWPSAVSGSAASPAC